jgi:FkbH-like protein
MKLIEALNTIAKAKTTTGDPFVVALVTGFTPLHLQTFLHAWLVQLFPDRRVEITTGLYGDIPGTLRNTQAGSHDAVVVILEWDDLDPRLGLRQLGGWSADIVEDCLIQTQLRLTEIGASITSIAKTQPVYLSLPSLPLPPVFVSRGLRLTDQELRLRKLIADFAGTFASVPGVRILNQQRLDSGCPISERLDVKALWTSGFPYQTTYASSLAELLSQLIQNPVPKKGLITDLDNTVWNGIAGEVGPAGVSWDLEHRSQGHGLYQQMLSALAQEGVLVAAASKNEPAAVEQTFARDDILLSPDRVFPFAVSWGAKSRSVGSILKQWNIGSDSVVFIDDDPLELAEVQNEFPDMLCLRFPSNDPQAIYELLVQLRDLFGKDSISEEDRIRLQSIRANASMQEESGDAAGFSEALLQRAEATVTFSRVKQTDDNRALELINKTNQFNLNGRRESEAAWKNFLASDDSFLVTVNYADRFGSLGKIAVLAGVQTESSLRVDWWVMSCRAFARRIEHQSLKYLFSSFGVERIKLAYQPTERNRPLTTFLKELVDEPMPAEVEIESAKFEAACPQLFHNVVEVQ